MQRSIPAETKYKTSLKPMQSSRLFIFELQRQVVGLSYKTPDSAVKRCNMQTVSLSRTLCKKELPFSPPKNYMQHHMSKHNCNCVAQYFINLKMF